MFFHYVTSSPLQGRGADAGRPGEADISYIAPEEVRTVALIGGGSVGRSWAALYLAAGHRVAVFDPAEGFDAALKRFVIDAWPALRKLRPDAPEAPPFANLRISTSLADAVGGADLVHENAPEEVELKAAVIAEIDAILPSDRLILSSAGGIPPSRLQALCRHPHRVLVAHPFNPPHLIPLVEIVAGAATSPAATAWTRDFMRRLGKRPVVLNHEQPGHLANRLQAAVMRESFHCLVTEAASAQDIDDALRYGLGLRWALMGGLMTFHLAGGEGGAAHTLDMAAQAYEDWWADLGQLHLTADVRQTIIRGASEVAGNRPIAEWVRRRDDRLADLIRATAD